MINASKEFKEKLKDGANIVNYADITLSDGTVLNLTYKDFMIGGCSIEDKTTDGKFGVGFCIGKTLSIRLENNDERFSQYDFYMSTINLHVGMQLDNGKIEKIRKGVYYSTIPETQGDIIQISAVDGMYKLDKDYSASTTSYPATLQKIITDACLDCGIPIGFRQFDNMNFVVKEKPESGTYRQILSYACQIAGYNAHIDADGYMQLVWYNTSLIERYNYDGGGFKQYKLDAIVDGGNFKDYSTNLIISGGDFKDPMPEHIFRIKSLEVHTDDVQITGVRVIGDDKTTALFGEEGYLIEVKGNPFVNGQEKAVADYLGKRIVGIVFRPFSVQIPQNPLYEPFEVIRISDRKGNVYNSIVNSVSYKVGGYTQLSCQAEDPVRNGSSYFNTNASAVVEARRNAEKQISEYDKAVQNMNQIAANSMGFHTTYEDMEDGSRITYMHDNPTLEDSKTIYKQSIDGFFISTDGGKSYTSGFDRNGNVVVNILYAIGIVADWIRTGKFEVKKGNKTVFLADCDTGEVRIIADYFSLSSGDTIEDIAKDAADDVLNDAKKYADKASKDAVDKQTQSDVLNRLTNDGKDKGIYLLNGKLYISFDAARGGELILGGANNTNGKLKILDAYGKTIGEWSNTGLMTKGTYFAVTEDGEMYSNDPVVIGYLYMSATVSSSLNTDAAKLYKAPVMDVAFKSNHEYTLDIGDIGTSTNYRVTKINIYASNGTRFQSGDVDVWRNFRVSGTKSRIVETESYSKRLHYCYEMSSPMFGDIGEGETDENGFCYVDIGDIFSETISGDMEYQVFLQKEGEGDIWVEKKSPTFFLVKGTSNLKFAWEIKAKQKGYEYERLESYSDNQDEGQKFDYEREYLTEIEQLILKQEELLYETT